MRPHSSSFPSDPGVSTRGAAPVVLRLVLLAILMALGVPADAAAAPGWQDSQQTGEEDGGSTAAAPGGDDPGPEEDVVVYERSFYDKYNPVTALDVVSRTPGFSVSRGRDRRGFGTASGNVLIDGERPSSKSDSVTDILSRISAGQVERVELIRGATGGLDVNRQSVVANVVLRGRGARGSGFAELGTTYRADRVNLQAEVSYDGHVGATDYLVGLERRAFDREEVGVERLTRPEGAGERREEIDLRSGDVWSASLRSETTLSPRDTLRLSGQFRYDPDEGREVSNRFPLEGGDPAVVVESSVATETSFEVGGDYERRVAPTGRLKLIGLARRNYDDRDSILDIDPAGGVGERRESISVSSDGETIGRLELDWGFERHAVQASAEVAHNFVDSEFELFEDLGSGFVPIDVEGANTRVSEVRGEWSVTDSWRVAPRWTVDLGLAFEISTISQSGDVENERTFRFAKPSLAVTYSPSRQQQWRFRFEREVAQLDFFDFVSSADFEDQELEFGNPDLEPERTWALEATWERRFGQVGVVEIRAFYDSIQEVQDLLPLGGIFEIPGNIGDGHRLGVDTEATIGLDGLGLRNSRLEIGLFVQDTAVTDPVTGDERQLSRDRELGGSVAYRQEFPAVRLSWGASYRDGSPRRFFGLDELVEYDGGGELELFLEKVVLGNVKVRFQAENLLDAVETRERRVFEGARGLSLIRFQELRDRTEGREFSLSFSRTF